MPFLGLGSAPGTPADNSVTSEKIANSTISADDLSSTAITDKLGFTPVTNARTLTINGTSYDLSSNRTWTIDALPSQSTNGGKYLTTDGTNASWATLSPTPIITSVSPSSFNGTAGSSFTINGANFVSGAVASFVGNNNTVYNSSTTTFVNSSQLTAVNATILPANNAPYTVRVTLPSGAIGNYYSISAGSGPSWTTASGSLGNAYENGSASFTVVATDPDTGAITYSLQSGSLPSGLTLNSSTGVISGTAPLVSSDTAFSFTIRATDAASNTADRSFSINVLDETTPIISSLSAAAGNTGDTITVTGSAFISTTTVSVGGVAQTTTYVNSTTLTFVVNASTSTTTQNVVVQNPSGLNSTLSSAFRKYSTAAQVKAAATFYTTSSNYDNYARANMSGFGNIGGGSGVIATFNNTSSGNVTYTVQIGWQTFTDDGATYAIYVNGSSDTVFASVGGNSSGGGTYTYTKAFAPGSYTIAVFNSVGGTCCGTDFVRVNSVQNHNIT